jgi:kexin
MVVPTGELIVHFHAPLFGDALAAWAARHGLAVIGTLPFGNIAILDAGEGLAAIELANQLLALPEVRHAYPNLWKIPNKRAVPNDPLYGDQWHLKNTGQGGGLVGADVRIEDAWDTYRGAGVVIGVVDDGLEEAHPDLSANVLAGQGWNYSTGTSNPGPVGPDDGHGSAAGGVAAARGFNGVGVTGAAPYASLIGINLLSNSTDANEAAALVWRKNVIDIYSNSWGPSDAGTDLNPVPAVVEAAILDGVTTGRGGKGNIYSWAGGNGLDDADNSNYDGYANSRYTIAVGAITNLGRQSWYSESGANLLVCAPSNGGSLGIATTDLTGDSGYSPLAGYGGGSYCDDFGGTSSACPLVSGVIALMIEANSSLTWRDVQQILAVTADRNDSTNAEWRQNGAGYWINHGYGFGRVHATRAVEAARRWINTGAEATFTTALSSPNVAIPDNNTTGVSRTIAINSGDVPSGFRLEYVEVFFTAPHTWWGDLEVILTSPAGTPSKLATVNGNGAGNQYSNWRFGSTRHLAETAVGTWTLTVKDRAADDIGTFQSWRIKVYGTTAPGFADTAPPLAFALLAPIDGTETSVPQQIFRWAAATDSSPPVSYRLLISRNVAFTSIVIDSAIGTATETTVILPVNDTYYWRVIASDKFGETRAATSDFRLVIDTQPPTAPALVTLAGADTASPARLAWSAASDTGSGIAGYRLEVDNDSAFGSSEVSALLGAATIETRVVVTADTWYWRVTALDRAGNAMLSSPAVDSFVVSDATPPTPFSLLSPAHGLWTRETQIVFAWQAATDTQSPPVSYRFRLSRLADFSVLDADTSTGSDTFISVPLAGTETLYWRVIASDANNNQRVSGDSIVRRDGTAPTIPAISAPAAGATTHSPILFQWSASSDTHSGLAGYRIEINTSPAFNGVAVLDSSLTAVETTLALAAGTYFWRVTAADSVGNVAVSESRSLTSTGPDVTPPSAFQLLAPLQNAETSAARIRFSWSASADTQAVPVVYRVLIARDAGFATIVHDSSVGAVTAADFDFVVSDTLHWRVIASDQASNTRVAGDSLLVRDSHPPTLPVFTLPAAGATVLSPVLFRWSASADSLTALVSYRLQVSSSAGFAPLIVDATISGATETIVVLATGARYARLLAVDRLGNVAVSESRTFTVSGEDVSPPTIVAFAASPSPFTNAAPQAVTLSLRARDDGGIDTVLVDLSRFGLAAAVGATRDNLDTELWTLTFTVSANEAAGLHLIPVTARDMAGLSAESSARLTIQSAATPLVLPLIESLREDSIIITGNAISLIPSPPSTSLSGILYQYRPAGDSTWRTVESPDANPETGTRFDGILWHRPDTAADGFYEFRMLGIRPSGETEATTEFVRVRLDSAAATSRQYHDTVSSSYQHQRLFSATRSETLLLANGLGGLQVPAGALAGDRWIGCTVLTRLPTTPALQGSLRAAGPMTIFRFDSGETGFARDVRVMLRLYETAPVSEVGLYYYDEAPARWRRVTTASISDSWIIGTVNHFTHFIPAIGSGPSEPTLSSVYVYPNPFVPNDGRAASGRPFVASDGTTGILFENLTDQVVIEVHDLSGRLVVRLRKNDASARYQWDARDDAGRDLASGVYLAVIRSGAGERVIRKIMIIR